MKLFRLACLCFFTAWAAYVVGAAHQSSIDAVWFAGAWNQRGFIGCENGKTVVRNIYFERGIPFDALLAAGYCDQPARAPAASAPDAGEP